MEIFKCQFADGGLFNLCCTYLDGLKGMECFKKDQEMTVCLYQLIQNFREYFIRS